MASAEVNDVDRMNGIAGAAGGRVLGLGTKCVHSGYRPSDSQTGSVMPPLYMTMNYHRENQQVSCKILQKKTYDGDNQ